MLVRANDGIIAGSSVSVCSLCRASSADASLGNGAERIDRQGGALSGSRCHPCVLSKAYRSGGWYEAERNLHHRDAWCRGADWLHRWRHGQHSRWRRGARTVRRPRHDARGFGRSGNAGRCAGSAIVRYYKTARQSEAAVTLARVHRSSAPAFCKTSSSSSGSGGILSVSISCAIAIARTRSRALAVPKITTQMPRIVARPKNSA